VGYALVSLGIALVPLELTVATPKRRYNLIADCVTTLNSVQIMNAPDRSEPLPTLKADLHVHSYFSGKTNHVKPLEPMDCYSSPDRIYELAKARGMDLVTITDHDSIDGCLHFMNRHPDAQDFIIGEEVTARLPEFGCKVHIAVYEIDEAQHGEIARLKENFDDLVQYLRTKEIIHVLNHFFHGFPKRQHAEKFVTKMLHSFDIFEGLNGAIGTRQNRLISRVIRMFPQKTLVAGSDSHTLLRLGSCYTAAAGRTKREFLRSLRCGQVQIFGKNGRCSHIFNDAMGVYLAYFRDIAFRNEVHTDWSNLKKVRNGLGWATYLPVFFTLSLLYSVLHFRLEDRKHPFYECLFEGILKS
jgi:predicted metal-dependent phosphoesterase TrpH